MHYYISFYHDAPFEYDRYSHNNLVIGLIGVYVKFSDHLFQLDKMHLRGLHKWFDYDGMQ